MSDQVVLTHSHTDHLASIVASRLQRLGVIRVYGIPRGGVYAALLVSKYLPAIMLVEKPEEAQAYIDDIVDSGKTRTRVMAAYGDKPFLALVDKTELHQQWQNQWVSFFWERMSGEAGPQDNIRRVLEYIGEDPNREGLKDTPDRVVRSYAELFSGYKQNPSEVLKTVFTDGACDEMVALTGISFFSTCEHHMLPYFGTAYVGYVPNGKVVGISKLARLVDVFSRRLQLQERITTQVTAALDEYLKPLGSACVLKARHMCMACRGVKQPDTELVTSSMTGVFRDKPEARAEFMALIRGK
jgi:GTP cyclohydrolase I